MEWPSRPGFEHWPLVGIATDWDPLWGPDTLGCFPYIFYSQLSSQPLLASPGSWGHRCGGPAWRHATLAEEAPDLTREGHEGWREEALPSCQELRTNRRPFAPSWQLDLTLKPSSSVLFIFLFLGVGFELSYFVYIAPKFHGTKDLQVQICPAFISFPSLFNLCDFNFPSLYC